MSDEEQMAALIRSNALDAALKTRLEYEKPQELIARAKIIEAYLKGDPKPNAD